MMARGRHTVWDGTTRPRRRLLPWASPIICPEIIDARSDCQKALTPTLTPIGAREQPKRQGKEGVAKS